MPANPQASQGKCLILLGVQFTILFRQQHPEQNNVYVFAILAREGVSRLHKFALGDLTVFIMVKIVDFLQTWRT